MLLYLMLQGAQIVVFHLQLAKKLHKYDSNFIQKFIPNLFRSLFQILTYLK